MAHETLAVEQFDRFLSFSGVGKIDAHRLGDGAFGRSLFAMLDRADAGKQIGEVNLGRLGVEVSHGK